MIIRLNKKILKYLHTIFVSKVKGHINALFAGCAMGVGVTYHDVNITGNEIFAKNRKKSQ